MGKETVDVMRCIVDALHKRSASAPREVNVIAGGRIRRVDTEVDPNDADGVPFGTWENVRNPPPYNDTERIGTTLIEDT